MNGGWIKLHRKLLDNPIIKKPSWAWLWVVLLLLANHDEEDSFIWNGQLTGLKKGQLITGRKKLKEYSGIPETTIEDILNYLENQHQIRQQKTTKYRVITILKWEDYQKDDRRLDNRATTERQQSDTFKKYKNDKKEYTASSPPPQEVFSLKREIEKMEENQRRDINIIAFYFQEVKPDIKNREQLNVAIRRHLRAARDLIPFTDSQLVVASNKAKKMNVEWTLETLVKILTK